MTYEIRSLGRMISYKTDGIKRKECNSQEQRQSVLLQIISQNPRIQHTHVIKMAMDFGKMAKRTVEKELARMEEEGRLESEKLGEKANSIRMWQTSIIEPLSDKETKNDLDKIILSITEQISQTKKVYRTLSIEEKAELCSLLLHSLNSAQPVFITVGKIIEIENRKKRYQQFIDEIYDILMTDTEFPLVFIPFLKKIIPVAVKNMDQSIKFIHAHQTRKFIPVTVLPKGKRAVQSN